MTELVDALIAELRAIHDRLATLVAGLTDDQLTAQSGAEDWTVADVLSHLGQRLRDRPVPGGRGRRCRRGAAGQPGRLGPLERDGARRPGRWRSSRARSAWSRRYEALSPQQRDSIRGRPRLHAAAGAARDRARHAAQRGRAARLGRRGRARPGRGSQRRVRRAAGRALHRDHDVPARLRRQARGVRPAPGSPLDDYAIVVGRRGPAGGRTADGATATFDGPARGGHPAAGRPARRPSTHPPAST